MAGRIHKGQLIDMVAESLGCSKAQPGAAVNAVLENVRESLRENDRVTLTGFGTFEVRETAEGRINDAHKGTTQGT